MITVVDKIEDANCLTHAGTFHVDEIFATLLLEDVKKEIYLYRSNSNIEQYPKNILVYDIGLGKFDHHGKNPKLRKNDIPYSSFGLLWQEYGREYIKEKFGHENEEFFQAIDKELVMEVDAIDNGLFPPQPEKYTMHVLGDAITMFNPTWLEENDASTFKEALKMGRIIFDRMIKRITDKVSAKEYVEKRIQNCKEKYLIFDQYVPFTEALLTSKSPQAKEILYAIFPSNRGGYNIKAIKKKIGSCENRLDFPSEWGGKSKDELIALTGIKSFRFCHTNLFLATCETLEDAILIADLSIKKE